MRPTSPPCRTCLPAVVRLRPGEVRAWPGTSPRRHFTCQSESGATDYEELIRADSEGKHEVLAWNLGHGRQRGLGGRREHPFRHPTPRRSAIPECGPSARCRCWPPRMATAEFLAWAGLGGRVVWAVEETRHHGLAYRGRSPRRTAPSEVDSSHHVGIRPSVKCVPIEAVRADRELLDRARPAQMRADGRGEVVAVIDDCIGMTPRRPPRIRWQRNGPSAISVGMTNIEAVTAHATSPDR